MSSLRAILWSSVIKKFINAVTGLALCGFIIVHLLGNIALLTGRAEAFNKYSHFLLSTGLLIYLAEIAMVGVFLFHAIAAVTVWWSKQVGRPDPYVKTAAAGGPSRKSISSRTMIYTGVVVLAFLVYHVLTFKYGPGVDEGYVMTIDGVAVRDLYRLVVETFAQLPYTIIYVAVMALLGFHLRHGFWSAFQSLGMNHPRYTPIIYGIALLFAVVMAVGFLIIPVAVYLRGGAA